MLTPDNILSRSLVKSLESKEGDSSYAFRTTKETVIRTNSPCYADLFSASKRGYSEPIIELCMFLLRDFKGTSKKWHIDFIDFAINDSPWRQAFKESDANKVYKEGVYLDVTKNATFIYSAMIFIRMFNEYPGFAKTYEFLRKKGFKPRHCIIPALFYQFKPGGLDGKLVLTRSLCIGDGHSFIGNAASFKNFICLLANVKQFPDIKQNPLITSPIGRIFELFPTGYSLDGIIPGVFKYLEEGSGSTTEGIVIKMAKNAQVCEKEFLSEMSTK